MLNQGGKGDRFFSDMSDVERTTLVRELETSLSHLFPGQLYEQIEKVRQSEESTSIIINILRYIFMALSAIRSLTALLFGCILAVVMVVLDAMLRHRLSVGFLVFIPGSLVICCGTVYTLLFVTFALKSNFSSLMGTLHGWNSECRSESYPAAEAASQPVWRNQETAG